MITNHNNVRAASCYMHAILFSGSHTLSGGLLFGASPFTVVDLLQCFHVNRCVCCAGLAAALGPVTTRTSNRIACT